MTDASLQPGIPLGWDQRDFIDALGDGVYGVDPAGCCIFINKAALAMLGYTEAEQLLGQNMHQAIHHTRPDGSPFPQCECPLLHTAVSGLPVRLENEMLWRRDGSPFFAEYSAFPVTTAGAVTGSVITFSNTGTRQDAQKRLAVQYAVTQVLAGSGAEATLPHRILEAIGIGLGWDVGLFWRREQAEDGTQRLECLADWRSHAAAFTLDFSKDRVGTALETAEGLPGQVWQQQATVHIPDIAADTPGPRQARATAIGLRSAFAFPVTDRGHVVGVVEFYSLRRIDADGSLMEAASTLGHQIGQALERRRVARALEDSERLKAAILASAPDCVITIDAECRIREFNETAARTFGLPADRAMGRDLIATIFPPDTHAAHRRTFATTLELGTAVIGRRIEVDAIRADGTRFPVDFELTRTATGAHPLFTAHLRDLTALRRQQARIRENEARFRTIANAIPQLAWMTGPDGAITWYNQRWYDYTGTSFSEMAGWGWRAVHHPDHIDRVEKRVRQCFDAGTDWEDTFPIRAKDGSYHWFLSRALPIREEPDDTNPEGRILGWFGSNTDITDLREAEQTLAAARDRAEAANRAKSTFIANMSHELRTPLSAIIGYAEMLTEELADGARLAPAALASDVQKIEANARHLLGLINDVLDLSKIESGKMEAYAETFDVAAMAQDVTATVGALMDKKDNRLHLQHADGLGSMHSDVTRIRQMLLNFLSNAAKFTTHGHVTVAISRTTAPTGADWLHFSVTDTGIGMTAEQRAKLFQRFQQADASTTRQFGGTGLGLALSKAFVTMLGGRIEVESTPGQGSTFTAILPAVLLAEPLPEAAAEPLQHPAHNGRNTVLVIDDDPTQRELMSRFLLREGFAARTAPDGPTGLALARQLRPNAILLDVTMPGMDGWSVLSALKADHSVATIPVVMVTFVTERALATALGAADYVIKPVDWDRLRAVMERFRNAEGDVLIVEDEADTRQRMRQTLEKTGWTVIEAANGHEAIAHVQHQVPRLILLDLMMPVMDGFDFLHALRTTPGCETVPVIVLTARDLTQEDRRRLRGANQVLNKGDTSLKSLAEQLRQLT